MTTRRTRRLVLPILLLTIAVATAFAAALAAPTPATAQDLPTIEAHAEGTTAMEGFFNLYWDAAAGALYLEIAELDTEFLYQISMGSGLGSNPVGIDRGQLRGTHDRHPHGLFLGPACAVGSEPPARTNPSAATAAGSPRW